MAIIKPTFGDILAGASFGQGQVMGSAHASEMLANHRLARLRQLVNWQKVAYGGTPSGTTKRAWYCGASGADGERRPQWASYLTNAGAVVGTHDDFGGGGSTVYAFPNADVVGGVFGCQYGTRQGLWSLQNSLSPGYWPTATVIPITGAFTSLAFGAPTNMVHAAAYPGSSGHARIFLLDSAGNGAVSTDDGATFGNWTVTPNPTWKMGAASLNSWVLIGGTKLYRSTGTATPTVIYGSLASLGVGVGWGVVYDSFRGTYHIWGDQGHAYSTDDGNVWTYDSAAPLNGKDIRAFGCSDDGALVAVTTGAVLYHCDVWVSLDGGSNWSLATTIWDPITHVAGCGAIEYGSGRFVIAGDNALWITEKVAL